ncbi:hypothetical protein AB4653_28140, partial [Vibrio sp. 10N.222.48.A3]
MRDKVHFLTMTDTPIRKNGGDGGDGLDSRVAKLEASVEYIQRDISDIKGDIKDIRSDLKEFHNHQRSDFRLLFGALIT